MKRSLFSPLKEGSSRAIGVACMANVIARSVNILSQVITFVVLARLLTPSDFGLVSMALPFIAILLVVGDLGLSSWTLQAQGISEGQATALFWVSFIAGLSLTITLTFLSPVAAWFYQEERILPILIVLSIQFFLAGIYGQHRALLQRSLRFGDLATVEITASLMSTATAITLALLTRSYWALVMRFVLQQAFYCIGVWIACRWIPRRPQNVPGILNIVKYGLSIVGFSILNTSGRQLDSVLIGWRWGSAALGPYAFATRIFFLPVQQLMQPLSEVMVPTLSKLRDNPIRYRKYFSSAITLVSFIVTPPFVIVAVFAQEVVDIVAGPGWDTAAPVLSVFAILGAIYVFYSPIGWLMLSHGRAKRYLFWAMCYVPIYILSYLIGLSWGPLGVAIAYAGANALVLVPSWYYGTKGSSVRPQDFARAALYPILLAISTAGLSLLVRANMDAEAPLVRLLATVPIALTMWAIAAALTLRNEDTRVRVIETIRAIVRPTSSMSRR